MKIIGLKDVDKVYLMGVDLDKNGIYVGWSPLFNYTTIKTLKDSELLPTPNGVEYTQSLEKSETDLDITDWVSRLISQNSLPTSNYGDGINNIKLFAEFLDYIQDSDFNSLYVNEEELINKKVFNSLVDSGNRIELLINTINKHSLYNPKSTRYLQEMRNSVSSKIYRLINDLKNFVSATSPVDMDAPQEAAKTSEAGKEARTLTADNPTTNSIMQFQNMSGREVIGIAAVGEKVFFALSNYFNEKTLDTDNLFFDRTFRINNKVIRRNSIANINFKGMAEAMGIWRALVEETSRNEGLSPEDYKNLLDQAINQIGGLQQDASLIISALLSSATDLS